MDPNTSGKNIDSFLVTVGGTNKQTAASLDQVREAIGAGTTASILEQLQGEEADPNRIGTEYMPENLEVVGVKLSDTTGVILPADILALDASGNLVLHDGATSGGVRYVPESTNKFSKFRSLAAVPELTLTQLLETVPLTAAQTTDGKVFRFKGTISPWNGAELGDLVLGFAFAANPMPSGLNLYITPSTNAIYEVEFDLYGTMTNGNITTLYGKLIRKFKAADTDGALTVEYMTQATYSTIADLTGIEATAQNLQIYIYNTAPTGIWSVALMYDISVEVY